MNTIVKTISKTIKYGYNGWVILINGTRFKCLLYREVNTSKWCPFISEYDGWMQIVSEHVLGEGIEQIILYETKKLYNKSFETLNYIYIYCMRQ